MKFRLPSSVFRLPSSVFRLPSSVFRLPSSVFRLPSSDFRRSALRRAALLIGLSGGSAIAANFTWVGAPGGTWRPWQTTANWSSAACFSCYPDDPSDNATITADYDGVNVELQQNESIGKLTINTDTDGGGDCAAFRSQASETNVLTVEGGEVDATNDDVAVTFKVGFRLQTD